MDLKIKDILVRTVKKNAPEMKFLSEIKEDSTMSDLPKDWELGVEDSDDAQMETKNCGFFPSKPSTGVKTFEWRYRTRENPCFSE